jgi:hypothetical protein
MEIGYGSQCWKLEVTPSGSDLNERALSASDFFVFLVKRSHSCASNEATFSEGTGFEFSGTNLKV